MNELIFKAARLTALGIFFVFWTAAATAQTATNSFSFSPNRAVPDGDFSGVSLTANLTGMSGPISKVTLALAITGGYNGDLYAYLRGPNGGFAILLNRPGVTAGNPNGYGDSGFDLTFDDSLSYDNIHLYQGPGYNLNGAGQLTGIWSSDGRAIDPRSDPADFDATAPTALLGSFNGLDPNGMWTFFLADVSSGGQSTVVGWSLTIVTVPEPSTWTLLVIGCVTLLAARKRVGPAPTAASHRE